MNEWEEPSMNAMLGGSPSESHESQVLGLKVSVYIFEIDIVM